MNRLAFTFHGAALEALGSGALYWPAHGLLVVSDLHLGKCARLSAGGGAALPPYDARETLTRLATDLDATGATRVICLGDSFDTAEIGTVLPEDERAWITRLQAGREWTWVEGNHDPGPVGLGGTHLREARHGALHFRHIAQADAHGGGEVSGHYHPKARIALRGRTLSRPCFLVDSRRLVMPAYGAYTGGLCTRSPVLSALMDADAQAILCGPKPARLPMPRAQQPRRRAS